MREHQVVINLKREQFEEVQRLARLAGSRSPSAYLRDRILNLLGMEQAEHRQQGSTDARSASDLTGVNQELSRMHRELQVFIAESLSSGSYLFGPEGDQAAFDEPYPPYVEVERQLEKANEILSSQAGQPTATTYGAPAQNNPGAMYSTGSMAASSPQIYQASGQAHSQVPGQAPGEQSTTDQSQDPGTQPWQTEAQQTDPNAAASSPEPGFGGAAGSSGTIGSRMASYQNISRYSNLFLPGAGIFDSRPQSDSGVWMVPGIEHMAGNSSLGLPSEINEAAEPIDQVSDELEELADRAFAISPRLGTTEEPRPRTELRVSDDDPLRDLLDDVLVEHIQQAPAVETASSVVYAPLPDEPVYGTTAAEVESESEESQSDLASGGAGSTSADDEDSYASAASSDEEVVTSSFPDQETDLEQSQSEESQPDDERGDIEEYLLQVSDENQSSAPAPTRPPMDAPPPKRRKPASDSDDSDGISGGPPPKRRRKPH